MDKLIENEIQFCKESDMEKNEHHQFIYKSANEASSVNMPYILLEYKQWLVENKIVTENK